MWLLVVLCCVALAAAAAAFSLGREGLTADEEKSLAKGLRAVNQAGKGKDGEDYTTSFEKSQAALKKAKADFAGGKEEVINFDVNGALLQYDAAMPVFWGNALGNEKFMFYEPGSFRDYGKTYVPNYEDSVFLSQSTGLPEYAAVTNRPDQMGGFCHEKGTSTDAIEEKCNSLPTDVCASTECCVFLGGSKCVAGNVHGPTTPSNYSDFTIQNRDYYYFKGKCYGNCYQNGASSMYVNSRDKVPATEKKEKKEEKKEEEEEEEIDLSISDAPLRAGKRKAPSLREEKLMAVQKELAAAATANTTTRAKRKPPKIYKVGDTIEVMLYNTGGKYTEAHGFEQWFSAEILGPENLESASVWNIKWTDGPLMNERGQMFKDTKIAVR